MRIFYSGFFLAYAKMNSIFSERDNFLMIANFNLDPNKSKTQNIKFQYDSNKSKAQNFKFKLDNNKTKTEIFKF